MSTYTAPASLDESSVRMSIRGRVAYLVSLFPCWSETFIAEEIQGLIASGFDVEIYSLRPPFEKEVHSVALALLAQTTYGNFWGVLLANVVTAWRHPQRYFRQLRKVLGILSDGFTPTLHSIISFAIAVSFARHMQAKRIEQVHAHWATYPLTAAWTIQALTGLPYSFTTHAHDLYEPDALLARKMLEADFIVTISEYNRALIRDICAGAADAHVVHCGVDTQKFGMVNAYRWANGRILSVGRLTAIKGFGTLIESCCLLRDRGIDFQCDIVGDGELRQELQAKIERSGLQDRVHLCGVAKQEEIRHRLGESAIFALACEQTPSGLQDGIPVALMEAMSSGIPVVSTRVSGIPELIEEGLSGVLVEQRDPVALADALQRLLTDRDYAERLSMAGRRRIEHEFSMAVNTDRMSSLLATSIARGLGN